MDKVTTRRLFLGGAVTALAISPFIIRNFRRTTQLPTSTTFPISKDPSVVPSGKIDVVDDFVSFKPLTLPRDDVRSLSLNATLSEDNKWIIVSYCFNENYQSQICYAPVNEAGLPDKFVELQSFDPKSVITGLGCSSSRNDTGRISYCLRNAENSNDTTCNESLFCVLFRQDGGRTIKYSTEPILLLQESLWPGAWCALGSNARRYHCWLNATAFVAVHGTYDVALVRVDTNNVSDTRFHSIRSLARYEKIVENGKLVALKASGNEVSSSLFSDGKALKFLETPLDVSPLPSTWDPMTDPFRTVSGSLFLLDGEGAIKSEEPFPVPAFRRKTLITKTHCLFPSTGGQFFVTAMLETPHDYTQVRFSKDEIKRPDSGIQYIFDPLVILPSGRHLLCARYVGRSYVDKAKEQRLPFSTLGVIELPFKVG